MYKRLTDSETAVMLKNTEGSSWDSEEMEAQRYIRLAELEDKIENGTLVEFPRIDRYVDVCYGMEKYLVQWVVNGKVKSRTFWSKKKAEKKLKELNGEI